MTKHLGRKKRTKEFKDKQKSLALFLFNLCNPAVSSIKELKDAGEYLVRVGSTIVYRSGDEAYYKNYMADANDILRSNPHLLGLGTREKMRL